MIIIKMFKIILFKLIENLTTKETKAIIELFKVELF